jgi:hypothetical protein
MQPGFQTEAKLHCLSKSEIVSKGLTPRWHGEFIEDLACFSSIVGVVSIPKGFLTDGATIPRVLWPALSATDPDIYYASFIHDFLYATHGQIPGGPFSKEQSDRTLEEQMLILGAPRWRASAVYEAVHVFGGFAFSAKLAGMRAWSETTNPERLKNTIYRNNLRALYAE